MRGIDPEYRQFLGKKGELFQRENECPVVRVALDVRIKLRRKEIAANHVALELGHIHAVGGESAECLVKRGRNVSHPKYKGRDDLAIARPGPFFLARQYDEARR